MMRKKHLDKRQCIRQQHDSAVEQICSLKTLSEGNLDLKALAENLCALQWRKTKDLF